MAIFDDNAITALAHRQGWRRRARLLARVRRAPLTSVAAREASQTIRLAIVAGCTHCDVSAPGMAWRLPGVSMVPGRIVLAVMPASLFSSATVSMSDENAALDALYAPMVAAGASAW